MALVRPASAAQTGSIRVTLDEPGVQIRLHYVAPPDGCLVKEFAGAGIEPEALLDTKQSPQNARQTAMYYNTIGRVCNVTREEGTHKIGRGYLGGPQA